MAQPGNKTKIHPSKRHNNPMTYKSGKPRLRGLTVNQLSGLLNKISTKKERRKVVNQLERVHARKTK
jgi:hypothetical protein